MTGAPTNRGAPLRGLRIVDLTTVVLGPYASQLLGEYGADVIKVEAPGGDSTRRIGPSRERDMAALFLGVNRNKRSVVLDLKSSAGRAALLELVDGADIFMHNMRSEKLESLGLGSETLRARCPKLIFAALLGFSSDGPYSGLPAYDDVVQGLAGMSDLMERQGGVPRYLPTALADKVGGLFAVQAILAAAVERALSGEGMTVEIPMFEALVSFGLVEHMQGMLFEPPLSPPGYERLTMAERRPFNTLDGQVCVMPYSDEHWTRLLRRLGDSEAATDPRFADIASRTRHISELYQRLSALIATMRTEECLAICRELDVPAGHIRRLQDLPQDPHLTATGHFVRVVDPSMGPMLFPTNPVRFDGWRSTPSTPPRLGQDNATLLRQRP